MAALYVHYNPRVSGRAVNNALVISSTHGLIQLVVGGTPNLALYSGFIPGSS